MKDFVVGIFVTLMGLLVTCGLFLGPPQTDNWMWWCLFTGPVAFGFGVWYTRLRWRNWSRLAVGRPRPIESRVNRQVLDELVKLIETDGGFGNAAELRVVGSDIDRRGGIGLMREYYAAVREFGVYFSQDIWDGIGDWRK